MNKNLLLLLAFIAFALGWAQTAAAKDTALQDQEKIRQIQELLESPIKVIDFPDDGLTLAKFLAVVEAAMPEGKKISFHIDEKGFGEDFAKVAGAKFRCPLMRNVSARTVLRKGLSRMTKVEDLDYAIRPNGVKVTRPRLSAHLMTYNVRDILRLMPSLPPEATKETADRHPDLKLADNQAMLLALLSDLVELRPWESVELLNGARLAVLASPVRQEEVDNLLVGLRRLSDTFVVMNARMYEVERAFYTKHVAPLFFRARATDQRTEIVPIDEALLRRISKEKLLLESEDDRLRLRQDTVFLSRHTVFRFAAGPDPRKAGDALMETGLAGVSFEVQPLVSPDGRHMRLKVSQRVAQLLGIDKVKTLDVPSGKDVEIESPNLRKTTVAGTITVPDAGAILMPVAYRPAGKENADKVWLMVARPYIWIEEEVKERRAKGEDISSRSVWDSAVPKEEEQTPVNRLDSTDDVRQILQAIVTDALTNPDLKSTREFYGTESNRTVALVDNSDLGWPKGFKPDTGRYKLMEVPHDPFVNGPRVLGIRIDKFNPNEAKPDPFRGSIDICLLNAGGSANGAVIGGCSVYYTAKRVGKRWTVECVGSLDP